MSIMDKKYSKSQLMLLLRNYVQDNGYVPSKRQLNKIENMPSDMAYRKAFGSWGNALIECGFEIPKPFPSENCKKAVSKVKKGKIREEASAWKGGRSTNKSGYVKIWNSELKKYELEHRIIMEKFLGRKLTEFEDVHHKNKIRDDNRIENLEVLTKSEHAKYHELHDKDTKHKRKNTKPCLFPECGVNTGSSYQLCTKHYRSQWNKVKNGSVDNLFDFNFKERKHTTETKKRLSDIAKKQPRKNGKFN